MGKTKAEKAAEAAENLRREANRQRHAARIGSLLQQLAKAADSEARLMTMIDEVAEWSQGAPIPTALDTSYGLAGVMAALARELGHLRRTAGDEEFSDLLADLQADLQADLSELWQAAHADPADEVIAPDPPEPPDPEPRSKKRTPDEAT